MNNKKLIKENRELLISMAVAAMDEMHELLLGGEKEAADSWYDPDSETVYTGPFVLQMAEYISDELTRICTAWINRKTK